MTARLNDRYASRVFHFAKVGGGKGGGQEKRGGRGGEPQSWSTYAARLAQAKSLVFIVPHAFTVIRLV